MGHSSLAVIMKLCLPSPLWPLPAPPTTRLPSPPSSTDSHTEPWLPLGMPSHTPLPTSHMPTPQLCTTPSTPDSSTPSLSPTSTMPQVMLLMMRLLPEAYVHDATGDVSDNSSPEAEAYVHDTTGDARKKREADAQVLLAGAHPYAYGY